METKTFEELFEKHNIITMAGNKEKVKSLCVEYARQIALAACEEQRKICANDADLHEDSNCYGEGGYCSQTRIDENTILNTPAPIEFINQLLNR